MPKNVLRAVVIVSLEAESSGVVGIAVSHPLACVSQVESTMVLFVSDNESYTLEKREDFVLLEEGVLELDARVFIQEEVLVLEDESKVLGVQAGAVRRGRPGVRGHRELNTAERVESCCGLEEACQEGRLRDVGEGGEA